MRAKGHPEHHGTIERLIGTMMRRIHERRGTTFGSVSERGDTEPDRLACLSLPELEHVVVFEVDRYNHSAQRWSRKFGQGFKLGSRLRRTDLNDGETEAVCGGFQGESCS